MTPVDRNIRVLEQLGSVLASLDDSYWTRPAPGTNGLRIGPHVRHILEFYESFTRGLAGGLIDYDARPRNAAVESSRSVALRALSDVRAQLKPIARVAPGVGLTVRDDESLERSTVGRELGMLMNHTIHHMALIALALHAFGITVDPTFGVAPATLRYREATGAAA